MLWCYPLSLHSLYISIYYIYDQNHVHIQVNWIESVSDPVYECTELAGSEDIKGHPPFPFFKRSPKYCFYNLLSYQSHHNYFVLHDPNL